MAPEVYNRCYSKQSDMWSLGMMMYHFLTRRFPFWCAACHSLVYWVLGDCWRCPVLALLAPHLAAGICMVALQLQGKVFASNESRPLPGLLQQATACLSLQSGTLRLSAEHCQLHAGRVWISAAQAHLMTSCVL